LSQSSDVIFLVFAYGLSVFCSWLSHIDAIKTRGKKGQFSLIIFGFEDVLNCFLSVLLKFTPIPCKIIQASLLHKFVYI